MFMAFWFGMGFQNLAGFTYSQLETLHDLTMVWLVVILFLVSLISVKVLTSLKGSLQLDSETLEKVWTLIPMVILITIATPSLHLLCIQDSMSNILSSTIKVISNQWNWQSESYYSELSDHLLDPEELDISASFEIPISILSEGISRMVISSTDVLHSLGIPSLGVKLDAVPGRLNVTIVEATNTGLFTGSCFELCGSGHSAMPINLLAL